MNIINKIQEIRPTDEKYGYGFHITKERIIKISTCTIQKSSTGIFVINGAKSESK